MFYSKIYELLNKYVPKFKRSRLRFPSWYTPEIKNTIKLKGVARKRYLKSRDKKDYDEFSQLRRKLKKLINDSFIKFNRHMEGCIRSKATKFWSYLQQMKNNSGLPHYMVYQNNEVTGSTHIANCFADFFKSTFSKDDVPHISANCTSQNNVMSFSLEEEAILGALRKLKPNNVSCPDLIPAFLVSDCAESFCKPLCFLFNLSFQSSIFPNAWKISKVLPIFKKGDIHDIENS
jgi:hypothetical protein